MLGLREAQRNRVRELKGNVDVKEKGSQEGKKEERAERGRNRIKEEDKPLWADGEKK